MQHLLKQAGLYHRLKASPLYYLYWSVADRSLVQEEALEVGFYRSLLEGFRPGDTIFDIGANQGTKTGIFLRLGARVVAVDPDEINQDILQDKFLKYRFVPKPVVIVKHAVSEENTTATMWIDEPGSAKNTVSRKWVDTLRVDEERFGHTLNFAQRKEVTTITVEQLVADHGLPFFIKIDVEGHELSVLKGMRKPVAYLSFEVNLPEFKPEGLSCIEVLRALSSSGLFNYAVDCRRGLALQTWLGPRDFSKILEASPESSIEVFWKNPDLTVR